MAPARSDDTQPRAVPLDAPTAYGFPTEAGGLLAWAHAVSLLETARNYWIVSVRPNGSPHVTPAWGIWIEGALYFGGEPGTRWVRNLMANPAVSVHLESAEDVVILEGYVDDPRPLDADLTRRMVEISDTKYGFSNPDPGEGLLRLRPNRARG